MPSNDNSPDIRDDDRDAVVIPQPRQAPDDYLDDLPKAGSDQPVWWYDQKRKRSGDRTYSGHVNHVHDAEAERVRGELAKVIQELLDWAAQQQSGDHSTEDGEAA